MKIGVPKEIKVKENRVGLVPGGVKQLILDGMKYLLKRMLVQALAFLTPNTSKREQQFYRTPNLFLKQQN